MLRNSWKTTIAAGLLLGLCTGCSSFQNQTVRGQSPEIQQLQHEEEGWKATDQPIQQVRGFKGELRGAVQNHLHDETVSHYRYRNSMKSGAYAGPVAMGGPQGHNPYYRYGDFHQKPRPVGPYAGFSKAPPSHQEQMWDHGGRRHRGAYNYHTYSYREPRGLVYPAPNQPAGVVTYPYYTHKGPSDFFWQGDTPVTE